MDTAARSSSAGQETRSRIIAAAKLVYEANGTRGTTTREVAERAGVNEATLFRHFGSKCALLAAMRERACPLEESEVIFASLSGDVRTDVGTIAAFLVQRMYEQRSLICISLAEEAHGESIPEWRGTMDAVDRFERYFAEQIQLRKMKGEARQLAVYFMGMCFSYVIGRRLWDSYAIKPHDLDWMVDLFLDGVR